MSLANKRKAEGKREKKKEKNKRKAQDLSVS
jgi:hypothetical protein